MTTQKNALFIFAKPPIPGLVKTRLTKERGGNLTNEEAAEFFQCSLLDVSELALIGLGDLNQFNAEERAQDPSAPLRTYDFFISTTPAESVAILEELFAADDDWERPINFLHDKGASFDEHFDDAFNQLFGLGYQNVVAIGGDLPTLPRKHISDAFRWLDYLSAQSEQGYAFVQAPCQQSGVSVVGQTASTPINSQGVYYNMSGLPVLDAYTEILQHVDVPSAFLNPVSDVDGDNDLAHAISCLNAIAEATRYQPDIYLARRVLEWIDKMCLRVTAPPNDEHDPRQYIDK